MQDFNSLHDAILNGDAKAAKATTEAALAAGVEPMALVQSYMIPAMDRVGRRFECNEYFVPELLLSARAMKGALGLVRPLLAAKGAEPAGRVVIGTVQGDLHDIGKNLVAAMLEGGGYEIFDLGVNVAPEKFVAAVKEKKADLVALSALLTTTLQGMKTTINALSNAGVRQQVKVLVGGAPVTQKFADSIGADAFGDNAVSAVTIAKKFTCGKVTGNNPNSGS
jgi:corrinoid protein of di/trimethylamine methyltransferase